LLKYAISHGILDLNVVRDSMLNEQKQHYLSLHEYAIFQDKDGRWKTTLPDKTKKSGRKLIARKRKDDLEKVIVDYYSELEINPNRISSDVTLEEIYPIWIQSRLLEVNSKNTVKKNDQDWRRYYKNTNIVKIPMKNLSVNQLKDWAHKIIDDNQLNKRDYYNMITIMKKCFEYVSDEKNICENTWAKVKINTKKLKRVEKKSNETQIYFLDEKMKMVQYCLIDFLEHPWKISSLAIPFLFVTGMRIGELVALKYEDFSDKVINVNRSEVNDYKYDEEMGKFIYVGTKVVDHTKTEAGTREIPFTKGAKQLLQMIKKSCEIYNYYDNDYVFCPNSQRMRANSIDAKIYRICEKIGISKKSAHKMRKTYITQIINNGVDLDTVCKISGHVDLKTTFESYYYSLERKDDVYEKFNNMFEEVV